MCEYKNCNVFTCTWLTCGHHVIIQQSLYYFCGYNLQSDATSHSCMPGSGEISIIVLYSTVKLILLSYTIQNESSVNSTWIQIPSCYCLFLAIYTHTQWYVTYRRICHCWNWKTTRFLWESYKCETNNIKVMILFTCSC